MSYQDDLILSMYNKGEAGLAMGHRPGELPPYVPPDKPSSPYEPGKSPAPSRDDKIANLVDGEADASIMNYVTEKGFFLDGLGDAYMQTGGKFYDAGGYNPDIHGLPVPLVQQMQINPDVANITPKDFSPPPFRYLPHIRIPAIKDAEMKHFKNFIEAMGGDTKGLVKNQTNPMMIATHDKPLFKTPPATGAGADTMAPDWLIDYMNRRDENLFQIQDRLKKA